LIQFNYSSATLIEGFDSLSKLALDMRWAGNQATDDLWRRLYPVSWELTHHPWDVLRHGTQGLQTK